MSKIDSILTTVDVGDEMASDDSTGIALPVGTVTLLMADAEGSTRLWDTEPDTMAPAIADHDRLVHEAIGRHGGMRPKDQGEGDSFVAAFSRPSDALEAGIEIQSQLGRADSPIRLRMAIHTGELQLRNGSNYVGAALNRAARLRSIAHGGQILISQVTHDLVADRQLKGVTFKELGVHRLKDLSRPERVFQVVHPDLAEEFAPLRSLDALPNNLPAQRTTFIGRNRELKELKELLANTRLLTLSGAGGAGKTRLGLQLAADMLEDFGDGVWFVPLGTVSEDELVAGQIASGLGIGESETRILPTIIGNKSMMVVLDNAEQVVEGASRIVSELLDASPNLKIIVTSREPLGIEGETTYRVPSLSLPAEGARLPIDSLTEYEAIQLFIDRAMKSRPNFLLDDQNGSTVAEICRRLDGIPLALELAAARIRVLSPSQILDGISDRFRLLTGSSRTAVPRLQTLRASVEWSHDLLDETEKTVFRRLAVFPSTFTLNAAEAVISSDDLPALHILDLLTQLVDKSLLVTNDEWTSTEYSMLETVRQYALSRLAESGEEEGLRLRHREFYADLGDLIFDAAMSLAMDVGEAGASAGAIANYETALVFSLERQDGQFASRLFAEALWWAYWEGRAWHEKYLDQVRSLVEPGTLAQARVLASICGLVSFRQELAPYVPEALEALRALPEEDASRYLPTALWGQAILSMYMDRPRAQANFEDLTRVAEQCGQTYWVLWGQAMGGYVQSLEGAPDEGLAQMQEAVVRTRALNKPGVLGYMLFWTGLALTIAGRFEEAILNFEESVPLIRPMAQVRPLPWFQTVLHLLTVNYVEAGRFEEARPLLEEAMAYSRDYQLESGGAYWSMLWNRARLELEDGRIDKAIEFQERSWKGSETESAAQSNLALSELARMEFLAGERDKATEHLNRALRQSLDFKPQMNAPGMIPRPQTPIPLAVFAEAFSTELPVRSARILGLILEWIDQYKVALSVQEEGRREQLLNTLNQVLGPRRTNLEIETGRNLSMEAAVAYALEEDSEPTAAALLLVDQIEETIRTGSQIQQSVTEESQAALADAGFAIPRAILFLATGAQAKKEDELHSALTTLVEMEDPDLVATCLEALAEIAADQKSYEESARLCGAALALRASVGRAAMQCEMFRTKEALGPDTFEEKVAEGKNLSMKEAAEYAARGRGERKRPSSGWSSLTPTELKVAGLVSEGLTNQQIAERLFISKRTVQTHLYNIFSKLNVSTRSALTAEAIRRKGSILP